MSDITRERIEARLKELDLSKNAASEEAGMDRSMLGKFLKGETKRLGYDRLSALARVLRTTVPYLVGETDVIEEGAASATSSPSTYDVPVVGIVEAGAFRPQGWFDGQNLGVIENGLVKAWEGERQFAFLVRGDHVDRAAIRDGDAVICIDPWGAEAQIGSGDLVVVESRSGAVSEWTVREMIIHRDEVELAVRSSNPRLEAIRLPADADLRQGDHRLVGVVTGVQRRFTVKRGPRGGGALPPPAKALPSPTKAKSSDHVGALVGTMAMSALAPVLPLVLHATGYLGSVPMA